MPADHADAVWRALGLPDTKPTLQDIQRRLNMSTPQAMRLVEAVNALAGPPEAPDCRVADEWRVERHALTVVVTITTEDGVIEMLAWAKNRLRWLDAKLADLEDATPRET